MNPQTPGPAAPLPPPPKKSFNTSLILGVLLVLALGFGLWAFSSKQSVVKNANTKLTAANAKLAQAQSAQTAADTANKTPYKTFTSSATLGSITFNYPKAWSAYVDETGASQPLDAYFYPGQVPGIQSSTAFALRVEVVSQDYAAVISQIQQQGNITASAYQPAKLKGQANAEIGTRFDGQVATDAQSNPLNGAMVVLKVRDKTLQIYTEANSYVSDFNNIVLPSLSYNP